MPLAKDLLHPSPEEEKRKHKKKRLVQSPNSYFMDVKCPGGRPALLPQSAGDAVADVPKIPIRKLDAIKSPRSLATHRR
ncbi:40S ribosomal protein S27 isoform X2 [Fukomys damarensis]|uniref:40S ribosomal protein S27 isoform X2 n=1 Tax=Fukomys damarensis TaxID=885580 RepID=UPI0008FF1869|nr:40S ribosomal protein S27 isoform X2 [Fukomys damarensis]